MNLQMSCFLLLITAILLFLLFILLLLRYSSLSAAVVWRKPSLSMRQGLQVPVDEAHLEVVEQRDGSEAAAMTCPSYVMTRT